MDTLVPEYLRLRSSSAISTREQELSDEKEFLTMDKNIAQMKPEESTIKRLAFIRYLLHKAVEETHLTEPQCYAALLTFHDAIELFLQLIAETLNIKKRNWTFMEYWEVISKKTGEPLSHSGTLSRLNSSRVSLKHKGIMPSKEVLEEYKHASISFLTENTPRFYRFRLSEASMVSLVPSETVRDHLKKAEDLANSESTLEGLAMINVAFQTLLNEHHKTIVSTLGIEQRSRWRDEIINSKFELPRDSKRSGLFGAHQKFQDEMVSLRDAVVDLRDEVRFLRIGLDVHRYSRFRDIVPVVHWTQEGKMNTVLSRPQNPKNLPTRENYDFCVNFVVDTALRLQKITASNP